MLNASFKRPGEDAHHVASRVESMCRMSALAATALSLSLGLALAGPADAGLFGKSKAEAAKPAAGSAAVATKAEGPRKASPEERVMADRLDPLGRAAFWARELDIDGGDIEAGVKLSQALRAMGKYDDAIEAAQRVLVAQPTNVEGLLEMARAQIGRGQGFYAIDPARQAQALAPRDWRAPALLAVAFEQAQRDDEALAAHRQALALAPENPAPLCNLALFYAAHGDAAQAETLLRKAAAKPGASITVRQNLALVLGLQGRFDEAEKIARQDLPPDAVANNMAYLRAAAGPAGPGRSWDAMKANQ
jgi:Flp pilus assembly protein TadD